MTIEKRIAEFCAKYDLKMPILMAPMSGACPPVLAAAVANAGGMGASGVLLDRPERIAKWTEEFRNAAPDGVLQLNIWIPDPPVNDPAAVEAARAVFAAFGTAGAPDDVEPDFASQCEAILATVPRVISSIMGLFDAAFVRRIHDAGMAWFACATTLDEALAAEDAGADAIVAQGMEAGGHRGTFRHQDAEDVSVSLVALIPQLADRLEKPIIAAGGIADGRTAAAALILGASAVQVGTGLLRTPEADISQDWSDQLHDLPPEHTITTRAYSGRLGRAAPTPFLRAWTAKNFPPPAPYPQQRQLLRQWRRGNPKGLEPVNHWAGQNAALATTDPAGEVVARMWHEASALLGLRETSCFAFESKVD